MKMNTKIVASVLVIALVLSVGMASALSNSDGGDWSYYKEITIKENSGKALSDYQVLVELNPSNFPDKAKSDGSDLRFAEDGKELSYWIEDYDAGAKTAKIWVKVSSISANSEAKIKVYYGNEKAGCVSDGDVTFEFFDEFSETSIDTNKWNIGGAVGTWSIDSGRLRGVEGVDTTNIRLPSKNAVMQGLDKWAIEWAGEATHNQLGINSKVDSTGYWRSGYFTEAHIVHRAIVIYISETEYSGGSYNYLPNTRYKLQQIYDGSSIIQKAYLEDGTLCSEYSVADATPPLNNYIAPGAYMETAYFDNLRMRKYTTPEPTISLSAEFPTKKAPSLTLTKSASPSTIQEGETTTISIRVENTGTGDAKSIEVTDTIPTGFKIISGSKSASFDEIKPGDYRTLEYTLKATGSGKFTCEPATATYKDADGNSYSAASNSVSIQVGGEIPVGADSDGDGWSDEKEREMGTNPYSVDSDGDGLKDPEDPNPTVPEEKKKTPGFEAVFAIAGLLAVAYLLRRRG